MAASFDLVYKTLDNDEFKSLVAQYIDCCDLKHGAWIAGGSVRKLWFDLPWQSQDVDVFFSNRSQYDGFVNKIKNAHPNDTTPTREFFLSLISPRRSVETYETANAISFNLPFDNQHVKVQAIKKYVAADIQELFGSFDFTVAQFATDGSVMVATRQAVEDCLQRQFRLVDGTTNKLSFLRTVKYCAYGFKPSNDIMKQLVTSLNSGEAVDETEDY